MQSLLFFLESYSWFCRILQCFFQFSLFLRPSPSSSEFYLLQSMQFTENTKNGSKYVLFEMPKGTQLILHHKKENSIVS